MKKKSVSKLPQNYTSLLTTIKQRIQNAQVRTALAGNVSMLMLYWDVGNLLVVRQTKEGWGSSVLPRLAIDLRNELPEVKGFSVRNLMLMTQFAREYPEFHAIAQPPVALLEDRASDDSNKPSRPAKGQPPVAQLPAATTDASIWQRAVAQLPWAHNIILIQKVKDLPTRLWYARAAFEHGWSRDVLSLQIDSQAHRRQGKAVTNFERTLPSPQSDLAAQLLKDPYIFDFLTLEKPFHELSIKPCFIEHENSLNEWNSVPMGRHVVATGASPWTSMKNDGESRRDDMNCAAQTHVVPLGLKNAIGEQSTGLRPMAVTLVSQCWICCGFCSCFWFSSFMNLVDFCRLG